MQEAGLTVAEVDNYLHARHAPEANAQLERINPDRDDNKALSGMSNEEAAKREERQTAPVTNFLRNLKISDPGGEFLDALTDRSVEKWRGMMGGLSPVEQGPMHWRIANYLTQHQTN